MIDSLAHGVLGLAGASAAARGTPDSLTWFARSRAGGGGAFLAGGRFVRRTDSADRKSTRLNSSHSQISYAVFCLKKKKIRYINRFRSTHTQPLFAAQLAE